MKVLAFAASMRSGSFNQMLIRLAARAVRDAGTELDLADLRAFAMPFYDRDLHDAEGLPPGAAQLARRVERADGLIIASPEYNHSFPAVLKNAIDWLSVIEPVSPLSEKFALLLSASSSLVGGARGLLHLRIPLQASGVLVHPVTFSVPQASRAFDEEGALKDEALAMRLSEVVQNFLKTGRRLAGRE